MARGRRPRKVPQAKDDPKKRFLEAGERLGKAFDQVWKDPLFSSAPAEARPQAEQIRDRILSIFRLVASRLESESQELLHHLLGYLSFIDRKFAKLPKLRSGREVRSAAKATKKLIMKHLAVSKEP